LVDSEDAMAQRLVRARHKIAKAGIPFEIPRDDIWPARLSSVLAVIYLVFNEGYASTSGTVQLRSDLCEEALRLARILMQLKPGDPDITGLLALMLITHSRRDARLSKEGSFVPLENQDRSLWNRTLIDEGRALVESALAAKRPGMYAIQAAISAVHAEARCFEDTRWQEIVVLYDTLHVIAHNPVYVLNRAVALSYVDGPQAGLDALESVAAQLSDYQPLHAAQADLYRRLGRHADSQLAYAKAITLTNNQSEKAFLSSRLLATPGSTGVSSEL
jgi:RNA polymerase sigma-70 factor (ECF subfamily)